MTAPPALPTVTASPTVTEPTPLTDLPSVPGPPRIPVPVTVDWLALREPADAAARSEPLAARLADRLAEHRGADRPLRIHDLGSGTGSMTRWLAPRLPGPQRWTLHDTNRTLLTRAVRGARDRPLRGSDAAPVDVEIRCHDVTRLTAGELRGADLVTTSALLDLLTAPELDRLVTTCAAAGCPALFTLTVIGRVDLTPADPVDELIREAFNEHQGRRVEGGRLLGPLAVSAAAQAFRDRGHVVRLAASPWRLGPGEHRLVRAWLAGWVAPAVEVRPELAGPARHYLERRREQLDRGLLSAAVHHVDLLALPAAGARP